MMYTVALLLFAATAASATYLSGEQEILGEPMPYALLQTGAQSGTSRAFNRFKAQYGHTYEHGSEEHNMRERLFRVRLAKIEAHNTHPIPKSWRMGVNRLTDRTEEELLQLRGFRRHQRLRVQPAETACSSSGQKCARGEGAAVSPCCSGLVCGARGTCEDEPTLPASIDWADRLSAAAMNIVDQSACGSCWAIAAQGVIELQAQFLTNKSLKLSAQDMLGCTPNPHECGGTGGCDGATPELAFDWARTNGVSLASAVPYEAKTMCPTAKVRSPVAKISGFVHVQENKATKVLAALVTAGPLAVAADASHWSTYASGVFDACPKSPVVDHAIVLMGYGTDRLSGLAYWKIRNSWGTDFGEDGYIRLRRHAPKGKEPCGWDYDPQKGVGCKGGPSKLWVCGECGILSDVAYPVGTTVDSEVGTI